MREVELSVIIPTFNREQRVCRAIESAINQLEVNSEVIVVDDASTDDSEQKIVAQFGDKVIYIKLSENKGAPNARNIGMSKAKGEYIRFLDSDDILTPDSSKEMIKVLLDEGTDIVYGNWAKVPETTDGVVDYDNAVKVENVVQDDLLEKMLFGWWSAPFSYIYRTKNFKLALWDPHIKRNQDYQFALANALSGAKYSYCALNTGYYIEHLGSRITHLSQTTGGSTKLSIVESAKNILESQNRLCAKYRIAIAENLWGISRVFIGTDPELYRKSVQMIYELCPGFSSTAPGLRAKMSKLFGLRIVDFLIRLRSLV